MTTSITTATGKQGARTNRAIRWSGILLLIYGLIEVTDCLALVVMQIQGTNLYPEIDNALINDLLNNSPIFLLPMFFFFTFFRLMAAVGVLRNRQWGFWAAIWVSAATMVFVPSLLPLSSLDLLLTIPVVALLLGGTFGDTPIIS